MQNQFKQDELASLKTVEARYGVVSKTLDKWIKAHGFPKPIMLNARKRVWPVAAILEWERSRSTSKMEAAE
jgi:predicted DNA-binding transcriptional regulator AlpA